MYGVTARADGFSFLFFYRTNSQSPHTKIQINFFVVCCCLSVAQKTKKVHQLFVHNSLVSLSLSHTETLFTSNTINKSRENAESYFYFQRDVLIWNCSRNSQIKLKSLPKLTQNSLCCSVSVYIFILFFIILSRLQIYALSRHQHQNTFTPNTNNGKMILIQLIPLHKRCPSNEKYYFDSCECVGVDAVEKFHRHTMHEKHTANGEWPSIYGYYCFVRKFTRITPKIQWKIQIKRTAHTSHTYTGTGTGTGTRYYSQKCNCNPCMPMHDVYPQRSDKIHKSFAATTTTPRQIEIGKSIQILIQRIHEHEPSSLHNCWPSGSMAFAHKHLIIMHSMVDAQRRKNVFFSLVDPFVRSGQQFDGEWEHEPIVKTRTKFLVFLPLFSTLDHISCPKCTPDKW